MSTLKVDNLDARTGTIITVPSATTMYLPGHIIQVVNTYLKNPFSQGITAGYNTYNDISGFSASITPKSVNSKIYMTVRWFGEISAQSSLQNMCWNIKRNGTLIGQPPQPGSLPLGIHMASITFNGDNADSTPEVCFFDYYDSPASTSSLTYQVTVNCSDSITMYTNRCVNATTSSSYERGTSSITLFEIAG
jgi:hypothetical protein